MAALLVDMVCRMRQALGIVRKLRLRYPWAIYHLLSCGDRREPGFLEEADRTLFLSTLAGRRP